MTQCSRCAGGVFYEDGDHCLACGRGEHEAPRAAPVPASPLSVEREPPICTMCNTQARKLGNGWFCDNTECSARNHAIFELRAPAPVSEREPVKCPDCGMYDDDHDEQYCADAKGYRRGRAAREPVREGEPTPDLLTNFRQHLAARGDDAGLAYLDVVELRLHRASLSGGTET